MSPELRPVGPDDAEWLADLLTECRPDEPTDPQVLRHQLANPTPGWTWRNVAVTSEGRPVGCLTAGHAPFELEPERWGRLVLDMPGDLLELAGWALEEAGCWLAEEGALVLGLAGWEDETGLWAAAEALGYRRDRLGRVSELDLRQHRESLLEAAARSRAAMAGQGIRLATLAAAGEPPPWGQITSLCNETEADIPSTKPIHPDSEAEVRKDLTRVDIRPDRVWLAWAADDLVGLSYLTFPPVRGHVWTDFTATARSHRGRGIARAVKMETLVQAADLGVAVVRTDNDEQNEPMLHINRSLGYRPLPGRLSYVKRPAATPAGGLAAVGA